MIRNVYAVLLLLGMLILPVGGGWLDGGPNYGEMRSYFSDPIFYSGGPHSKIDHSQYYPYFGSGIFKDPSRLGGRYLSDREPIVLGKVARRMIEDTENEAANRSAPGFVRYKDQNFTEYLQNSRANWTMTMDFARNKSSLRVYDGGRWTTVPDVNEAR